MNHETRRKKYSRPDGILVGVMKLATGLLLWDIATHLDALGLSRWWAPLIAAWAGYFSVLGATGLVIACLPQSMLECVLAWVERRRR